MKNRIRIQLNLHIKNYFEIQFDNFYYNNKCYIIGIGTTKMFGRKYGSMYTNRQKIKFSFNI